MRLVALVLLSVVGLTGCISLHADVPEDVVRRHMAREDGVEIGAICSHEGQTFSEGAIVCMSSQRMTCDANGRWGEGGSC